MEKNAVPNPESDSTVCITLRCAFHCAVRLHGVFHTTESSSTVCIIPPSLAPPCASYRGVSTYQVTVLIRSFTNAISL